MDTTDTTSNRASGHRRRLHRRRGKAEFQNALSDGLLALVLVGSVLAIGTVHIPTLMAVSAIALIGAIIEARALRRIPLPAIVLAVLSLISALQATSLPAALVKVLSPVSANIWLRCLVPFGEPALRRFPLSLDPSASIAEALKWLTYAAVYIMATRARARRGSTWLAVLLFGSATLVAFITLLHGVADLPELYGLYHPDFIPGRWNVGPLLNSNNLAGYALLGLFTGGGLIVSARSPLPRLALMIGVGIITAALALSGSRAGVLSVLVVGTTALVWLMRGKGAHVSVRGVAFGAAPLLIGIAVAIALGDESTAAGLATLDVERKVSVWAWSVPMIREHLFLGVGRGAFETGFQPYRGTLAHDWANVVTHAENFVLQWIAEWGAPVGLCAVVLIVGYVLREWYRSRGDRLRFMVLSGVVALLLQNLADLGLEVPAIAIAAVVALATGERSSATADIAPGSDSGTRLGRLALIASVPAVALWAATLAWSRFPVDLERRELSAAYGALAISDAPELAFDKADELAMATAGELSGGATPTAVEDQVSQFRGRLREATLRHPGEAFFPLLGSVVAVRTRDPSALKWLSHTLELGPANGSAHLVLADLMHSHDAIDQAMLHLRLAVEYDGTLIGAVSTRAAAWAPSIELLMRAIPDDSRGREVLLESCAKARASELKLECFRRGAQQNRGFLRAQLELAEALLLAIKAEQPPCKDALAERCTSEAETAIRAAARLDSKAWRPSYLLSKVRLARGDTLGAAQLLTRTCPSTFEGDECWHEALSIALKGGAIDTISVAANALGARPCDGMESCARMFSSLAATLEGGGQPALASKFFIKAAEAEPSAERWLKVAELAAQAHLNGVARAALDRANRSYDASASSRAHVEVLRQRVARTAAP